MLDRSSLRTAVAGSKRRCYGIAGNRSADRQDLNTFPYRNTSRGAAERCSKEGRGFLKVPDHRLETDLCSPFHERDSATQPERQTE
jgi:hypothetical protein